MYNLSDLDSCGTDSKATLPNTLLLSFFGGKKLMTVTPVALDAAKLKIVLLECKLLVDCCLSSA